MGNFDHTMLHLGMEKEGRRTLEILLEVHVEEHDPEISRFVDGQVLLLTSWNVLKGTGELTTT